MLPNCCHLLTDLKTVFVFALGPLIPMWVFFFDFNGPMAINGHFPIKIPIKVKKITFMGRKGPRAKTKTVLKSVSK